MSRGAELGVVVACCQDESGLCVIVEKANLVRDVSEHSSIWRMDQHAREIWQAHEVIPCAAWKFESDVEVTVIAM